METAKRARLSSIIALVLLGGCASIGGKSCENNSGRKPPSTAVDTERLDAAIKKSTENQDGIIKDAQGLERELPDDSRPPAIVEKAQDTKIELAKADQTVADLIAKAKATDEIVAEKDKTIETQAATIAKLEEDLNSSSNWFYGLMIMIGAVGIAVSLAVMLKLDKQIGSFGLVVSVASVVTGYFLREFACWIPLIGAGCAVWGGVMFWRQHTKDQEAHKENDEAVRELVATTADIQQHGWTKDTRDRLASTISEPTREKVREARAKHKIRKIEPPIELVPAAG